MLGAYKSSSSRPPDEAVHFGNRADVADTGQLQVPGNIAALAHLIPACLGYGRLGARHGALWADVQTMLHLNSDRSRATEKAASNQLLSFASIFRPSPSASSWRGDDWLASTHTPAAVGSLDWVTANGDASPTAGRLTCLLSPRGSCTWQALWWHKSQWIRWACNSLSSLETWFVLTW